MKSRSILTVLAVLVLALAGCGRKYPDEVKEQFLEECESSGGTKATCACSFEKVQETFTFKEYIQLDRDARAGKKPPKKMVAIVLMCAGKDMADAAK